MNIQDAAFLESGTKGPQVGERAIPMFKMDFTKRLSHQRKRISEPPELPENELVRGITSRKLRYGGLMTNLEVYR